MQTQAYQEISLSKIRVNPQNPRKNFEGEKFDQLVASIKEKGVIEPIVVRRKGKDYEVVAGERRFRASVKIDPEGDIPAVVRELSDDEAFEFMIIENLQREDLTEREEAESFKSFLEKKGEGAAATLAERTGIRPAYIRRRIAVLSLPDYVLESWEKGEFKYGHLEQLLRIANKPEEEFQEIATDLGLGHFGETVAEFKEWIDDNHIKLKDALFNLKQAGCLKCSKNSDVQNKLFDIGGEKGICHDGPCFKKNQADHLTLFWKRKYKRKYKTSGFVFRDDVEWSEFETFYSTNGHFEKCLTCDKFLTLLYLNGNPCYERICNGGKSCLNKLRYAKDKEGKPEAAKAEDVPRVEWHGRHYREEFFKVRIPEVFDTLKIGSEKADRITLIAMMNDSGYLRRWFGKKAGIKLDSTYYGLSTKRLFDSVLQLNATALKSYLKEAALALVMEEKFGAAERWAIAEFLGIDLSKEYAVTRDYLENKTIAEMLRFGDKSGLFTKRECLDYKEKHFGGKGYDKLRKKELIDVFMKSGVDLLGKVPKEITDKKRGVL